MPHYQGATWHRQTPTRYAYGYYGPSPYADRRAFQSYSTRTGSSAIKQDDYSPRLERNSWPTVADMEVEEGQLECWVPHSPVIQPAVEARLSPFASPTSAASELEVSLFLQGAPSRDAEEVPQASAEQQSAQTTHAGRAFIEQPSSPIVGTDDGPGQQMATLPRDTAFRSPPNSDGAHTPATPGAATTPSSSLPLTIPTDEPAALRPPDDAMRILSSVLLKNVQRRPAYPSLPPDKVAHATRAALSGAACTDLRARGLLVLAQLDQPAPPNSRQSSASIELVPSPHRSPSVELVELPHSGSGQLIPPPPRSLSVEIVQSRPMNMIEVIELPPFGGVARSPPPIVDATESGATATLSQPSGTTRTTQTPMDVDIPPSPLPKDLNGMNGEPGTHLNGLKRPGDELEVEGRKRPRNTYESNPQTTPLDSKETPAAEAISPHPSNADSHGVSRALSGVGSAASVLPQEKRTVPGFWFLKTGTPHADVLTFEFEVDEATLSQGLSSEGTPSPLSLCVVSLPMGEVKAIIPPSGPGSQNGFDMEALRRIDNRWPGQGQLLIDLNKGNSTRKTWFPWDLGPDCSPLDVTPFIHPGLNVLRFIQLTDLSSYMFLLHASTLSARPKAKGDDVKPQSHLATGQNRVSRTSPNSESGDVMKDV